MRKACGIVFLAALCSVFASAGPIPPGWLCTGNCGTDGPDGVVTLSPFGSSSYEFVSTSGGAVGAGELPGVGGTNGSALETPLFSANAGDPLNFYFNFVTTDGAGYADYAWAELVDANNNPVALLFDARTEPSGTIAPGIGLPTPVATLTPSSVPIIGGGPVWSPLADSGACYAAGCGYTGWILSSYVIPTAGNYKLEVGVTNWIDQEFDTGMALDGVTVAGAEVGTPEPASFALIGLGLSALTLAVHRRKQG